MTTEETKYPDFVRSSPWDDGNEILSLFYNTIIPDDGIFLENSIVQKNLDRFFNCRFDLMIEAESVLRSTLGLLVDFRQKRKLTHFLLGFCDLLEITYEKNTGSLRKCRFQIDLSDGVSILYSSRMCGCIIMLDGKQDSFHRISPRAIDDLRRIIADVWESIRGLSIWEVVAENENDVTIQRRNPIC